MITAAQHGTSIRALFVIMCIAWGGVAAFYVTAFVTQQVRDRRSIRRCRRQSVRAVRGLGAQLLADEAALRRQSGGAR